MELLEPVGIRRVCFIGVFLFGAGFWQFCFFTTGALLMFESEFAVETALGSVSGHGDPVHQVWCMVPLHIVENAASVRPCDVFWKVCRLCYVLGKQACVSYGSASVILFLVGVRLYSVQQRALEVFSVTAQQKLLLFFGAGNMQTRTSRK